MPEAVKILDKIIAKENEGLWDSLNPHERKITLLNKMEFEIFNGGWDQFLWNSTGDYIYEYKSICKEFGYNNILAAFELIEREIGQEIPTDPAKREDLIRTISEETDEKIIELFDEDIHRVWEDIENYISQNEEHFTK